MSNIRAYALSLSIFLGINIDSILKFNFSVKIKEHIAKLNLYVLCMLHGS